MHGGKLSKLTKLVAGQLLDFLTYGDCAPSTGGTGGKEGKVCTLEAFSLPQGIK